MKIGVADYGMNVWDGGCFDIERRLTALKEIGYEGTERLSASSSEDAIRKAALYRKLGMDYATCSAPDIQLEIEWASGFRKSYIWISLRAGDFNAFCRQSNILTEACLRWGLQAALHNHLGSLVESQQQLEEFLAQCPKCGLIFDTAHLAAANGNCLEIAKKYTNRIVAVHLKDWLVTNPGIGLDKWPQRGRFCELGAGNIGLDNAAVMKAIVKAGYDGWVFVEHDTHLQEPLKDLTISRQYLRQAGF